MNATAEWSGGSEDQSITTVMAAVDHKYNERDVVEEKREDADEVERFGQLFKMRWRDISSTDEARIEDSSELVESGQRSAKAKILSKESWVENTARGCVDTVTASHDVW